MVASHDRHYVERKRKEGREANKSGIFCQFTILLLQGVHSITTERERKLEEKKVTEMKPANGGGSLLSMTSFLLPLLL